MQLPDPILGVIDALESRGYPTYAVGGCVRDALLGLRPHDYDLCSAATPEQLQQVFSGFRLVLAGLKHGTVGVVTGGGVVEITTFRTEGGYHDSRHPDWVRFVPTVEQDLARRDFTVNAMAFSPTRGLADPFGGQNDLKSHILRAVGDPATRFTEDALRILRGVRFAVRFRLTPDSATMQAMEALAPLLDKIARERVFEELCKLLPLVDANGLHRFAPILAAAIPELGPMMGFDQHSPYHAFDLFGHTARVCAAVPGDLTLRWAALLHDTGKVTTFTLDDRGQGHFYGHAEESAHMADAILRRLKAPTALREQVVTLIRLHMTPLEPDKRLLRRRLGKYGEQTVRQLLLLQRADREGTGKDAGTAYFDRLDPLLDEILAENACLTLKDLALNGHDLMALGCRGKEIGQTLEALLTLVQDEKVPNEKAALLTAAKQLTAK